MTFDLSTIKTRARALLHRGPQGAASTGIVDPVRDWKLILLGFSLLVLAAGAWSFFSYTGQISGTVGGEETATRKPRLDRDALTETLETLEARRSAHEAARAQAASFVDPGR